MFRVVTAIALTASAGAAAAQPIPASLKTPPPAMQLFERDWVLMNWALKYYDANRDIMIEPQEAQAAAEAFRKLADSNGDGRVTPDEYQAARKAILMRE